ncbi:MAG TPA: Sec-independent protein translocase protein TatB [Bordetella sp.]
MFDISFSELAIIGVVALVVIGPERLPKVARTVGHLMGRAQRYVNDVKSDIQREIELDEFRNLKQSVDNAASELRTSLQDTENTIRTAGQSLQAELAATTSEAKQALDLHAQVDAASSEASAQAAAPAEPATQAELPLADATPTPLPTPAPTAPAQAPAPSANATTGTPT